MFSVIFHPLTAHNNSKIVSILLFMLIKADYGNYGARKYPTYGDYYRTHRYPINDGWMLWDEDLRDLDSKSNKIGSGKDGGR